MLKLDKKKQSNLGKLVPFSLQLSDVKLVKKGPAVYVEIFCVERAGLVVVRDKYSSGFSHVEHLLLRRDVEAWFLRLRDAKILYRGSITAYLHKVREHVLGFVYYVADVCGSYRSLWGHPP